MFSQFWADPPLIVDTVGPAPKLLELKFEPSQAAAQRSKQYATQLFEVLKKCHIFRLYCLPQEAIINILKKI